MHRASCQYMLGLEGHPHYEPAHCGWIQTFFQFIGIPGTRSRLFSFPSVRAISEIITSCGLMWSFSSRLKSKTSLKSHHGLGHDWQHVFISGCYIHWKRWTVELQKYSCVLSWHVADLHMQVMVTSPVLYRWRRRWCPGINQVRINIWGWTWLTERRPSERILLCIHLF